LEKILVSACFLGNPVRYNGTDLNVAEKVGDDAQSILDQWAAEGRIVSICPEVSGGLSTPRAPAEMNKTGQVISVNGLDVTDEFIRGAENALALCKQYDIKIAVMTESSPSCGSTLIYDGSFSNTKISGQGVTARLLTEHGVKVFSQFSLVEADNYLRMLSIDG
jgi:uncharacterized protein YbbK (DUF523 family)